MKELDNITGQLLFREAGPAERILPDGRKLVMVVGLLAVPPETEIKPEHQYTLAGKQQEAFASLVLHTAVGIDRSMDMAGASIGSALKLPIWRV